MSNGLAIGDAMKDLAVFYDDFNGVFKQLLSVDLDGTYRAPPHLKDIEATALPLTDQTAYRTVFTKGQIVKGQNVLITGIGGGVTLFVLQYAVAVGFNVYAAFSDDSKIERAIQLGAKGGANYRKENWEEQLLKASNGQQIDVIIDGASGPGADTILSKALVLGGIFVTYGQTAGDCKFNIMHILHNIEVRGSTMGSRVEFEKMLEFVEKYQIRPIVS
ncbi:hypothetical protein BG011_005847 [Mortierella polycephala]|uniref:Alcohol dehydrogenase-like C-terminal domain-containing protein n=1 Tax=Mortierella polycephala TaxID=41804 RepID=A0A9P6QDP7_9FUNG|nr:hypothetical protein BG011_005847 [Mortierella polycephala]